MTARSLGDLTRMKREGRKIAGVVAWDHQVAQIVDSIGVDIISVGDSVGIHEWGMPDPLDVTLDQMMLVAGAVTRGVRTALTSCDLPFGPVQRGPASALRAATRLVEDAGVDMVKLDDAAHHPKAVAALADAGIHVFAQMGITPHSAARFGLDPGAVAAGPTRTAEDMLETFVGDARRLADAGATLIDFTNSGPVIGPAVVASVDLPVLGGMGGGPWLDGRLRLIHAAAGFGFAALDDDVARYGNVAREVHAAVARYVDDVRDGRWLRGEGDPSDRPDVSGKGRS